MKKLAEIHASLPAGPRTLFCGCEFKDKRVDLESCGYHSQPQKKKAKAEQLEWNHVVPAKQLGNTLKEWQEGAPACEKNGKSYKGKKCASKSNPDYREMSQDMHNLWPEIGELNARLSDRLPADIGGPSGPFGGCDVRLQPRKFEPAANAKGTVARVYLYMDDAYPGHQIVTAESRPVLEKWNADNPVTLDECVRAKKVEDLTKTRNRIVAEQCKRKGLPY